MKKHEIILKHLAKCEMLDDENLAYTKEKVGFTWEEYNSFFWVLRNIPKDINDYKRKAVFPTWRVPFRYKGFEFVWRLMSGQGDACQLFVGKPKNPLWEDQLSWFGETDAIELTDEMIQNTTRWLNRIRQACKREQAKAKKQRSS